MATRRLYYDNAFEKEFSASVLSCEPVQHANAPAWGIVLDATAFYPTSGGQPYDLGRIGEANVIDVREEGEEILHVVDKPISEGHMQCCIDWPRRFDHMQQHTGQHLLSAMFLERFGLPTVSFHLGAEASTIDLRGPEPSEAILEGAERAANEIIFEDRPVTVRYGTAQDLARLGVRKEVEREGILRAIEIERADLQPCGGTHVQRTGEIGTLLVRRCTKMRQDWRVEFVCGARAERVARQDFRRLRAAAEKLDCPPEDLIAAAERAATERDANFKRTRALLQRLAELESARALGNSSTTAGGLRIVHRVFDGVEQEFLGFFAAEIAKSEKSIALLARTGCGHLIFAQHASAGKDMNALLRQVLEKIGGKGGGTRDFARGKLNDPTQAEAALAVARETLASQ
ncbi:MAG TPA: DHHA1 domain-containing protein [Candidatus Methylomirabilis sp.]|nr:DHHA1 domain-containing protein [Candidatus Methylomirabilis sp.]